MRTRWLCWSARFRRSSDSPSQASHSLSGPGVHVARVPNRLCSTPPPHETSTDSISMAGAVRCMMFDVRASVRLSSLQARDPSPEVHTAQQLCWHRGLGGQTESPGHDQGRAPRIMTFAVRRAHATARALRTSFVMRRSKHVVKEAGLTSD